MSTYRTVPDDRIEEFRGIQQYAFDPSAPPETDESIEDLPKRTRPGSRRGLFDDADLLSVCKHHWFDTTVRGGEHPLAGVAGVATPPEHRRQGFVAELLAASLAEYRERGYYLSALWPFSYAFYRQYGWAQAGTTRVYECDPEALSFAAVAHAEGERFRRLKPDDFAAMDRIFAAAGEGVSLWTRRSEEWWRNRIFTGRERDPYVYGVERAGDLRGYVVYDFEGDDGRTIRVDECNALDHAAFLALLRFLHDHDSQVERVRIRGQPGMSLFDSAANPRAIDCELVSGGMIRVVDVERALAELDYPTNCEGRIVLSVHDPTADWNDDIFALDVTGGDATCTRVDERSTVDLPITTLSQLFVGHFSVERAQTVGDLTVDSEEGAKLLDGLFPSRDVCLSENF